MPNSHLNIKIFGKVQGVFFRETAKVKANTLEITGFIKNEPDGSVYIEAEGEDRAIDEFVKWCKIGPQTAKVEGVETELADYKNFREFLIL